MIKTENHLQKKFLSLLQKKKSPWGHLRYSEQFGFNGGRTDVIATNSDMMLFAFEIKLEKWKIALNQAYRNTTFANKSYVVLPKATAARAIKYEYQFKRRSVGLCYIEGDKVIELLSCEEKIPIIPWLNTKAMNSFGEYGANNR